MKRFIALLTGWLLWFSPQAQNVYTMQYWFDGQYASRQTISSNAAIWQPQLDVGNLAEGMHTLSLHIQDTSGIWTSPRMFVFYRSISFDTIEYNYTMDYTCWYDHDYSSRFSGTIGSGGLLFDVSQLRDGMHTISIQLGSGRSAQLQEYVFYRPTHYDSINYGYTMDYTCWYDHDYSSRFSGAIAGGGLLLDVSQLRDGMHTISIQLGSGRTAQLQEYVFYRPTHYDSINYGYTMDYTCWYDHDYSSRFNGTIGSGGLLLDVSQLRDGMHTISIQLGSGRTAQLQEYVFYRPFHFDSIESTFAQTYTYWFDHEYSSRQTGTIVGGGMMVDVSQLRDGLHTFCIQLGEGRMSQLQQYVFYKPIHFNSLDNSFAQTYTYWFDHQYSNRQTGTFVGGNMLVDVNQLPEGIHTFSLQLGEGSKAQLQNYVFLKPYNNFDSLENIVRYEYILNGDESDRHITHVSPCDTLHLITLLSVDTLPVRSTCFEFNPNGGAPVIYAKNDIRLRFWTEEKRFAEYSTKYVDENVVDTIYADTIERGATKTIAAPTNNNIHWFKLAAGTGDSLSFNANRRCTMQLFAPSGELVLQSSGDSVLTWVGCHAWENGVYYLAVHDAEGTGNMSVSYQWIYKYAVLDYSPHSIGNVPALNAITLFGNGFDKLFNVSFVRADTIWQIDTLIAFGSNNACVINTVAGGLPIGDYDMILEFADTIGMIDTINVTSAIEVTSAIIGGIDVSYYYTSSFSEPHIISLIVTNTSNIPYMAVPLVIAHSQLPEVSLSFRDVNLLIDTTIENVDSLYYSANNLFGQGVCAKYIPLMIPYLEPYETRQMQIEFHCPSGSGFDFYAWYGRPWSTVNMPEFDSVFSDNPPISEMSNTADYFSVSTGIPRPKARRNNPLCNMPDPCSEAGRMPEIGDLLTCLCGLGVANVKTLGNAFLAEYNKSARERNAIYEDDYRQLVSNEQPYPEIRIQTPSSILREAVEQCAADGIVTDAIMRLWDHLDGEDCPDPPIPIHPEIPAPPVDPNDIIGYSSPSGSHAINGHLNQLQYTIEFENDSNFAQGMAHVVVVTDTLDGNTFDLNSFSATSFSIGEDVTTVDGGHYFARTFDMRPEINVITQVMLDYHILSTFSVAIWTFTSLDPMTLQPAVADTLGFLGLGNTGEVNFTINRKANLPDSTIIDNRAWITFDNEEPIATSTWRNIIDATPPVSSIDNIVYDGDSAVVAVTATDNLSGVWRYNVYARLGSNTVQPVALNIPVDSMARFIPPTGVVQYHSAAIDSAGNMEAIFTVHDTVYATSCDTYTLGDNTYSNSGEYVWTRSSSSTAGFDSVTVLYLTINHSTARDTSATVCNDFTWHGITYTESESPSYQITNAVGCDSTITLHLTVNHSSTSDTMATVCDSLLWHGVVYRENTQASSSLIGENGCDSIVTLNLTVNYSTDTTDSIELTADELPYNYNGIIIDTAGVYTTLLETTAGCDSTVLLNVTVTQIGIVHPDGYDNVWVHPNPTTGVLTIVDEMALLVEVYDGMGRKVHECQNTNTIDISSLPSGSYTLRITLQNGIAIQKVIKQ